VAETPDLPLPDKGLLIGGCARLPLAMPVADLLTELDALGPAIWGTRGGRVGVHRAAEAVFLRGHAPAEGDLPIADRPVLDALPSARAILALLGDSPQHCLLARLPAGAVVPLHIDRGPYFAGTVRLHVPLVTSERVYMAAAGRCYRMATGEAWALNNGALHGVWNSDAARPRTHLIADFLPTPALLARLAGGDRELGADLPDVWQRLAAPGP
jgi:hypothetical protein